jgi:hypothetical protein
MDGITLLKEFDEFIAFCLECVFTMDVKNIDDQSSLLRNSIVSMLQQYDDLYTDYELIKFGSEE